MQPTEETWSLSSPQDPTPVVEYETQAELWLPKSGIATARKLQASQQRKKGGDKKDSQLSALGDGSPRRLRERSSWLGMSKSYGAAASGDGQWVRVRCTLIETDERECRLIIIGDKETLQHSLNIRHLHSTDIRFADRSLLFRNDCLCITASQHAFHAHSPSLQAIMSPEYAAQRSRNGMPALDPIFLAFDHKDAAHTWCAILRSYTVPEIYGCDIEKPGLYRMWRQVSLSILNATNVSLSKKTSNPNLKENGPISVVNEEVSDAGPDLHMYCEILFDGVIVARTMHQKGQGPNSSDPSSMWTWHETFTLSDLPSFRMMFVRVWGVKKGSRPILVGTVEMALAHPRRGQLHEGWFPIVNQFLQVGALRMKIKVDEEHILPSEEYASITSALDQCNCLDLLSELDQQLRLSEMSIHMLSLAVGRETFAKDIYDLAEREVQNAPNANTLFRGNSIFTKTVEHAMTFFGRTFLEASVGPSIQELISERVELETDPSRNLKGAKDVEASVKLLPIWCGKFWSNIYSMREHCPPELRKLFKSIRELVEERFKDNNDASNLKWQSISAFCFLRLIVPAILHPHLWGLYPGLLSPGLQRSLTLIAKVLQSLANLAKDRKDNQQGIGTFLENNRSRMIDYINQISSVSSDRGQSPRDRYDRARISNELKTRREETRSTLPLHSESIPVLPHLLDIPKHLAIVTSAVTRHARANPQTLGSRPLGMVEASLVEDFSLRCFEIEDKILGRVKRVEASLMNPSATVHPRRRKKSTSPGTPGGHNGEPSENSSGPIDEIVVRQPREIHRTRRSPGKRPSTAPARSSSADSASIPLPASPPPLRLRGKASDDSWVSSPSISPMGRTFGHQSSASASLALSESTVTAVTSDTEFVPDISPNSQLDMDSLDSAKPRKAFFRSLLGR